MAVGMPAKQPLTRLGKEIVVAVKKRTPAKKVSFGDAVEEVEGILARLEAEEIDIDDLSREVKRAVELIKICRDKLEKTDSEVRELVADLEAQDGETGPAGAKDASITSADGQGADDDASDAENLPF
jgi:exodeoxyribonuclease VII small subunit